MSDIFISYSSQDRETAGLLADALVQFGWSVWRDRDIAPGEEWSRVMEKALTSSRCVIVLWSSASVDSGRFAAKRCSPSSGKPFCPS